MRLRPNPPRMITVLAAVALLVIGLAGTLVPLEVVTDLVGQFGFELDRDLAYLALFLSPVLLVTGSLLPGI
ncbi:MAG: hypothetical protein H0X16_06970 [Chloroflexi bacterium]|nr:hypothetical protein [Chloroflexota bacterium]